MEPVVLTEDEAQALTLVMRAEKRAQQVAEIAVAEARLPWMKAAETKNALLAQLGEQYGFDPEARLQFDPVTRTILPAPPNGNGS